MDENAISFLCLIYWLGLTITNPIIGYSKKIGFIIPLVLPFPFLAIAAYLQGTHQYILGYVMYVFPNTLMLIIVLASARKKNN